MDAFQLLEDSGHVAPPDDAIVEAAVDLVLADAFHDGDAHTHAISIRAARRRAPRRRAYLAGAAAVLVAAAATAIPLSLGGGAPSTAPVMRLASYRLRLPAHYRLTAAITSDCHPYLLFKPPTNPWNGKMPGASSFASQVASAASAADGCVFMALLPPYTPTASNPDPEQAALSGAEHVQIGQYQAWVGTTADAAHAAADGDVIARTGGLTKVLGDETMLYVEIPLTGGQTEDLVVGSSGLSQADLISLVANGLSAVGGNSGTGNTGTAGTSGANAS